MTIARKRDDNREAHGTRLRCFRTAVQNGGTFHTIREEIAGPATT